MIDVLNLPFPNYKLLSSDDQVFNVEKAFLAVHSPVFRGMFGSCSTDEAALRVDETASDLQLLLETMYNQSDAFQTPVRNPCAVPQVARIVEIADKYGMSEVLDTCDKLLCKTLAADKWGWSDSLDWFVLAVKCQLPKLQHALVAPLTEIDDALFDKMMSTGTQRMEQLGGQNFAALLKSRDLYLRRRGSRLEASFSEVHRECRASSRQCVPKGKKHIDAIAVNMVPVAQVDEAFRDAHSSF